jgi:hypothetical protein
VGRGQAVGVWPGLAHQDPSSGVAVALGFEAGTGATPGADPVGLGAAGGVVPLVVSSRAGEDSGALVCSCDMKRIIEAAGPPGDVTFAATLAVPKMSTANPTPTATSFNVRPNTRLRPSAMLQRDSLARGVGPTHDEDPASTIQRMSSSSWLLALLIASTP